MGSKETATQARSTKPLKDVKDDVSASLMQHHLAHAAAVDDVDQDITAAQVRTAWHAGLASSHRILQLQCKLRLQSTVVFAQTPIILNVFLCSCIEWLAVSIRRPGRQR
jgi:hypothetical protein